jgi:hypothetical protein
MKGFIRKLVGSSVCAAATFGLSGCYNLYRDLVDPCWPQRYNCMAEKEVICAFAPQVHNGHVLDQTMWNYHFEDGSDKLTPGGLEHLAYLARRRPEADPMVYLQTAQDLPFNQAAPGELPEKRLELDNKRIAAIKTFLMAQTGGMGPDFQVIVHDPAVPGQASPQMNTALTQHYAGARGVLAVTGTGSGPGTGGSSGGSR